MFGLCLNLKQNEARALLCVGLLVIFLIDFLMSASAAVLFELCGNMPVAH